MAKNKKKPKLPKPMGRPSEYTAKLGVDICKALVKHRNLKKALKAEKILISYDTVHEWRFDHRHEDFSQMYARARQCVVEDYLDDIFIIAEEKPKIRQVVSVKGNSGDDDDDDDDDEAAGVEVTELERVDSAAVQANRNLIDTIKWMAVKVIPKTYGEKLEVEAGPGLAQLLDEMNKTVKKK